MCPLYFGCPLCFPDPFSPSRCGSGSGQIMRIRLDPDPQHCLKARMCRILSLCGTKPIRTVRIRLQIFPDHQSSRKLVKYLDL